jgi:hypothetical protein
MATTDEVVARVEGNSRNPACDACTSKEKIAIRNMAVRELLWERFLCEGYMLTRGRGISIVLIDTRKRIEYQWTGNDRVGNSSPEKRLRAKSTYLAARLQGQSSGEGKHSRLNRGNFDSFKIIKF